MTPSQLLLEGVELMLFGIGFVFAFLVLLILCIRLMSYLTGRFVSAPALRLRLHRMPVLKQTRTFLQPSRPRFINTARAAVDSGKGVPSMTVAKSRLVSPMWCCVMPISPFWPPASG